MAKFSEGEAVYYFGPRHPSILEGSVIYTAETTHGTQYMIRLEDDTTFGWCHEDNVYRADHPKGM